MYDGNAKPFGNARARSDAPETEGSKAGTALNHVWKVLSYLILHTWGLPQRFTSSGHMM